MKKFTKQEIDDTRDNFIEQGYKEVELTLDGHSFSYFVLPQSLYPSLPDFVFRCTGDPTDGYVLGISESVREDFRPYPVFHKFVEFIEFADTRIAKKNRCLEALGKELAIVPDSVKPEYLIMRRDFFRKFVEYCKAHPEEYSKKDILRIKNSLSMLEELVGQK
jgi:hypothetical protein